MGLTRITQYIHRPNATEIGLGNTHECYMLVGTDVDMSDIFPLGIDVSIHDANSSKEYTLKSSNVREFRINQMGDIYRDYNVTPGDEILISHIVKNGCSELCFTVNKLNRVVLFVKNETKNGETKRVAEIVNIDRLKPFEKGLKYYEINVNNRGKQDLLKISFDGAKAKRADSPNLTDYYLVQINDDKMPNGTYYLTLNTDGNTLAKLPKSDFNTIEFDDKKIRSMGASVKKTKIMAPLQQIYYGAPGTGKSFEIKRITKFYSTIRTTFHPDSDYSTFVGAYKPVMAESTVYGLQGEPIKVSQKDGTKVELKENRITYSYVKQAFLKAYLGAWQKYAKGGETTEPQFLVIEEINRGNCAQIFGDLFQLLDRSDDGFSTYPIEADSDLQKEIEAAFDEGGEYALENGFDVDGVVEDYTSNYEDSSLTKDIKKGRVLLFPNNLYIWATMNTSDQSLFPIDSAFKRRWDWRYVKITDAGKGWKIQCGGEYSDWWAFVTEINKKIAKETSSDDKKLGYFFCKPAKDNEFITEDKFVGKVLFYLWNDVFKDGDITLFKVSDNGSDEISYDAFYNDDNKVNIAAVRKFLVNVVGESNILKKGDIVPNDDVIPIETSGEANGNTRYIFNGKSGLSKKDLGLNIVIKYITEHKDKTFEELQSDLAFDNTVKYKYAGIIAREDSIKNSYLRYYVNEQTSANGIKYKVLNGWSIYNIDFIIGFAKKQGWTVEEVTE